MPRILLIEDNAENNESLARRLRRRGYNVISAFNGQEGCDAAREEHPDLVLMDLNMPVLDGWQAATILRADPVTKELPIIGITAHAIPGDRDKAIQAGCTDYHTKPIEFPQLLLQIEGYLREHLAATDNTPVADTHLS